MNLDLINAKSKKSFMRMKCHSTRILAPYRACGLICSEVVPFYEPSVHLPIQGEFCCPIDSAVLIYSIKPFRLFTTTDPIGTTIEAVAKFREFIYICAGNSVFVLKFYARFKQFKLVSPARFILPCGDEAFVIVEGMKKLIVFSLRTGEQLVDVEFPKSFEVNAIIHPTGYVNQVLVGSTDGRLRLVDVEKGSLIREFPAPIKFDAPITVIEQSTAADIIAVGHADGRIQLRHLKLDRVLFSFRHEGRVTALSFRTDDVDTLVSGADDGSLSIWDLERKVLVGRKANAHAGPILSLNFLVGEAFFITSSTDNRLVKWILKSEASLPEIVKEIEGPSRPISSVAFTGSHSLLFASEDGKLRQFYSFQQENSLKSLGLAREVHRRDVGKHRYVDVPLTTIVETAIGHARENAWDNVICRHADSPIVSTWTTRRLTRGSHVLCHDRFVKDVRYRACHASSIFLSNCGTFALIGYSSGHFDVFNVQSGKHRHSFVHIRSKEKKSEEKAHVVKVTGVALDLLNRTAVSGAADGGIHFWSFKTGALLSRIHNESCGGVTSFHFNRDNSLLAVTLENGDLAVVDVLCRRMARHFQRAHRSDASEPTTITALTFSADGKWLVSTDDCRVLKIWDLASGNLIDVMRLEIVCKGMCFNETGEFLATIHKGQRAIYIWSNLTLFLPDFNVLSLADHRPNSVIEVSQLPRVGDANLEQEDGEENDDLSTDADTVVVIDEDEEEIDNSNTHLAETDSNGGKLLSLSGLPPSRWANLAYLDIIRERNKPLEPPKKPENAPFFLLTTENLQGFSFEKMAEVDGQDAMMRDDTKENGNVMSKTPKAILMAKRTLDENPKTNWTQQLLSCKEDAKADFMTVFQALSAMNISSIDFHIRQLPFAALQPFLKMISVVMEQRECFDLTQAYLAVFLNAHNETLWVSDVATSKSEDRTAIAKTLNTVLSIQKEVWTEVQRLVYANTSLTKWIKSALI